MFPEQLCHICTFWGINMLDVPYEYLICEWGKKKSMFLTGMLAGFSFVVAFICGVFFT